MKKQYLVIIPFEGIYFDTSRGRQEYGGELRKHVSQAFGSALTQDGAALTMSIMDDGIADGVDTVMTDVGACFVDVDESGDADAEEAKVDIEIYMESVTFKAGPEEVAQWAHENGWMILDAVGIEEVESGS